MADVTRRGRDESLDTVYHQEVDGSYSKSAAAKLRYFNTATQLWENVQGTGGAIATTGAAGGGGAATIADGADVAQGATGDLSTANTVVGILKAIKAAITGTLAVSGTFWQATQPVSLATNTPDVTDRAARLLGHVTVDNASVPVTGTFFQATQPVSAASLPLPAGAALDATLTGGTQLSRITDGTTQAVVANTGDADVTRAGLVVDARVKMWNGASFDRLRGKAASIVALATDQSLVVQQSPMRADASTLAVTTISAANTTVTLTLPAPAAGLFHYITSIEIVNINATITAIAAAATLLSYTTTNLPGSPAWNCGTLLAAGAEKLVTRLTPATPLKSSVAATATTVVAPAIGTGAQVRITATYYTAP